MRYAVISDLHANLEALENVLADAAGQGARQIVCLGDVLGYGPLPVETLARVRGSASVVLAGNHDDAVSGRIDAAAFIDLAADAVGRHKEQLSERDLADLGRLPYTAALEGGALAAHGDFTDPESFRYIENEADAAANFRATDAQLMFVGHTHVPALFIVGASGTVYALPPQDFTLEEGKRYIVNPGSVGYPREQDGVCRSSYVLYDSDEKTVSFRFLPFSVASVLQRGPDARGPSPRVVAALVLAAATAVGAAAWYLTPKTETAEIVNVTELRVGEDPALRLAVRTLTLPGDARYVRANLKVERGPVVLRIVFADANGREVGTAVTTVKRSAARREKIPAGAITAAFTVSRPNAEATPEISAFAPAAAK